MGTKNKTTLTLIIGALVLLNSTCKKSSTPCVSGGYSFAVTSEYISQGEIYNLGDTIFLTSTFQKTLTDLVNSSLHINYSNSLGIGGSYAFYELDTVLHEVKGAVTKFNFITINGQLNDGTIVPAEQKAITYDELSDTYAFSVKIIPQSKGIFAFYVSDLHCAGLSGQDCTNAGFSNTLTNTNKNLNLFEYAMNRPPASQYEIDRIYCFRVQ